MTTPPTHRFKLTDVREFLPGGRLNQGLRDLPLRLATPHDVVALFDALVASVSDGLWIEADPVSAGFVASAVFGRLLRVERLGPELWGECSFIDDGSIPLRVAVYGLSIAFTVRSSDPETGEQRGPRLLYAFPATGPRDPLLYARVAVTRWRSIGANVETTITFPEATTFWSRPEAFALFDAATAGTLLCSCRLSQPNVPTPGLGARTTLRVSLPEATVAPYVDGFAPEEVPRCPICNWPLAATVREGCVLGNCSYRPDEGSEEHRRIQARRATLAAAKVRPGVLASMPMLTAARPMPHHHLESVDLAAVRAAARESDQPLRALLDGCVDEIATLRRAMGDMAALELRVCALEPCPGFGNGTGPHWWLLDGVCKHCKLTGGPVPKPWSLAPGSARAAAPSRHRVESPPPYAVSGCAEHPDRPSLTCQACADAAAKRLGLEDEAAWRDETRKGGA